MITREREEKQIDEIAKMVSSMRISETVQCGECGLLFGVVTRSEKERDALRFSRVE